MLPVSEAELPVRHLNGYNNILAHFFTIWHLQGFCRIAEITLEGETALVPLLTVRNWSSARASLGWHSRHSAPATI